jgi:hypothetical protein
MIVVLKDYDRNKIYEQEIDDDDSDKTLLMYKGQMYQHSVSEDRGNKCTYILTVSPYNLD